MYYNETIKIAKYFAKYPNLLIQSIVEDSNTEQYAHIIFNVLVLIVILLMFFLLFCGIILLGKACWVIFQGLCYWFFGRDTLKEFLIKTKAEDRELIKEMFKSLTDEIKNILVLNRN